MTFEKKEKDKKSVADKKSKTLNLKKEFSHLYGWQLNSHPEPKRVMSEELFEASIDGFDNQLN